MTTFEATPTRPGPDGNEPAPLVDVCRLALRDAGADRARPGGRFRYLEGRAVPFEVWGNVGWYMELHEAASFKHSTKAGAGRAAPLLLFHENRSFPIGHAETWRHDDGGLDGVWRLNDRAEAQEAAELAEAGDLTGMSIGFQPMRSLWDLVEYDDWDPDAGPDHMDKVRRQESRLLEVSITPTPAFVEAQVAEVRAGGAYEIRRRSFGRGSTAASSTPYLDQWRAERDRLVSSLDDWRATNLPAS